MAAPSKRELAPVTGQHIMRFVVIVVFFLVASPRLVVGWSMRRGGKLHPSDDESHTASNVDQDMLVAQKALQVAEAKRVKLGHSASVLARQLEPHLRPAIIRNLIIDAEQYNEAVDHTQESAKVLEESLDEANQSAEQSSVTPNMDKALNTLYRAEAWLAVNQKADEEQLQYVADYP